MEENNNNITETKYESSTSTPASRPHRHSRRTKNNGCAGTVVYVIAVLGISIVLSLVAIFMANDIFAFTGDDANVQFVVTENTDVADLSKQLDQSGILHYGSLFKKYVELTHKNASVLAGTYTLSPSMDYTQVVNALVNSENKETISITIPEGYSNAQIRELLLENHVCTEDAIDAALSSYSFKHDILKAELPAESGWLEGYLFPDTYELFQNNDAVDALNKMLNNFENKYDAEIQTGAAAIGRSTHDIVVIASLIEREAKVDEEYARIAGVIYNRLNNADSFPFLQVDAAVLYGLGRTSGTLSQADLASDTPYNTYTQRGLPPGPICNPGYKSLYAASHPEQHNYFYYVAMPDGSHLFANSNEEQNNNIAISNQAQAAASSQR